MDRDFKIKDGIYLVQGQYELDLHNNFDFKTLTYSVDERRLSLEWERTGGDWVQQGTPQILKLTFFEVDEFRFLPRDPDMPFSEDDCINQFGYLVDEDWADGVITPATNAIPEPHWLTAIDFMSGAIVAVQASRASAQIKA